MQPILKGHAPGNEVHRLGMWRASPCRRGGQQARNHTLDLRHGLAQRGAPEALQDGDRAVRDWLQLEAHQGLQLVALRQLVQRLEAVHAEVAGLAEAGLEGLRGELLDEVCQQRVRGGHAGTCMHGSLSNAVGGIRVWGHGALAPRHSFATVNTI